MKKWVWVGIAGVVLLWLLGAGLLLPAIQTKLERAARAELAKPEYTNAFDDVQVSFSGQEATLTGRVSSQREHDQAGAAISEKVRVADSAGSSLNPVTNVVNRVGVDYSLTRQRPKPWLLIARYGNQATIAGIVPVEWKDQATKVLSAKLAGSTISNQLNAKLSADAKPRPAVDANGTLDPKAVPALADGDIAVSPVDGHWVSLKATAKDTEVSEALTFADAEFSNVVDALAPLRAWQAAEKEKVRQAGLPLAYAGVAALPDSLHVYGLVGDDDSQRRLLVALGAAYPKRKILTSALKLSADIRSGSDWNPSVSALPKTDGAAFIAALKAGGKPFIWDGKGDQAAMQKALSPELPKTFAFADLWETYGNWEKAKNAPPPAKIAPPASPPAAVAPPAGPGPGKPLPITVSPPAAPSPASPPPVATPPPAKPVSPP